MDEVATAAILQARAQLDRRMTTLGRYSAVALVLLVLASCWVASFLTGARVWRVAVPAVMVFGGVAPLLLWLRHVGRGLSRHIDTLADERERQLEAEARRRHFEAQVANALDLAHSENEALQVVERAFTAAAPHQRVELLLADNSHAHLERKASTTPDDGIAGCPVAAPFDCPAARRGRMQRFDDADALDACPKLAGRLTAGSTAVCVPVSLMGRASGVIHTIGATSAVGGSPVITQLGAIAEQVGARMAMLRLLAETQVQASTDSLTGLLNRRAFENGCRLTSGQAASAAVAMVDLDRFKALNDTHGHDTGDRALRMFADVLRSGLRQSDLVARYGGEEFAVFFPHCDAAAAVSGLQRVRDGLRTALAAGGLPAFTASFGVVERNPDEDLDRALARADLALFAAKRAGRDRVVVHDADGREQLFPATAFPDELTTVRRGRQ